MDKKAGIVVNSATAIIVLLTAMLVPRVSAGITAPWQNLAQGLDLRTVTATQPSEYGDSRITVVRIDPAHWELTVVGVCQTDVGTRRTARQWAHDHDLTVAINAGMFATDHRTHVGYLRYKDHVNSSHVNGYQSIAAFDPRAGRDLPDFRIFDHDAPDISLSAIKDDYSSVIQNLRLIKRPGENRWHDHGKMWSEAALGEDAAGRVLLIFTRSPFGMPDLNRELLAAGLDLVAAQHLEGGPEAQLYLRIGDIEVEQFGSYETGFYENDDNAHAWALPFVLGFRPRALNDD